MMMIILPRFVQHVLQNYYFVQVKMNICFIMFKMNICHFSYYCITDDDYSTSIRATRIKNYYFVKMNICFIMYLSVLNLFCIVNTCLLSLVCIFLY